jgi:hypothetical protein
MMGALVPDDDLPAPVATGLVPPEDMPPAPSFVEGVTERAGNFVRSLLPAASSPFGMLADVATSGGYGSFAPKHGGLYTESFAPPTKQPGESGADYLRRAELPPSQVEQGMALAGGFTGPGVRAPVAAPVAAPPLKTTANRLAASALKGTAGEYKALGAAEIQELGDWLLRNKAVRFGDRSSSILKRVEPMMSEAGRAYDTAVGKLDATGAPGLDKLKLRDAFLDAAVEEAKHGPAAQARVNQYLDAAQALEADAAQSGPTGTFSQGEAYKQGYQKTAYPKGKPPIDPTPAQVVDQRIASIARQQIEDAAEQAAQSGDFAAFLKAKADYGASKTAKRILAGAEGRAEARNLASPSDKMSSFLTYLATQNPVTAAAVGVGNKLVRERAASSLAVAADKLAGISARPGAGTGAVLSGGSQLPAPQFPLRIPGAAAGEQASTDSPGSQGTERTGLGPSNAPYNFTINITGSDQPPADHFVRWMTDPSYPAKAKGSP